MPSWMIHLNYLIAFTSGIVSFFAPCVVPLLPIYIGYVTGVSAWDLKTFGYKHYFKKILLITDTYKYLYSWLFDIAFRLGYQIR